MEVVDGLLIAPRDNEGNISDVKEYGEDPGKLRVAADNRSITKTEDEITVSVSCKDKLCESWSPDFNTLPAGSVIKKDIDVEKASSDSSQRAITALRGISEPAKITRSVVSDSQLTDVMLRASAKSSSTLTTKSQEEVTEESTHSLQLQSQILPPTAVSITEESLSTVLHARHATTVHAAIVMTEVEHERIDEILTNNRQEVARITIADKQRQLADQSAAEDTAQDARTSEHSSKIIRKGQGGVLGRLQTLLQRLTGRASDEHFTLPQSLQAFGLSFNEEGILCSPQSGQRYVFHQYTDRAHNEALYKTLCQVVCLHTLQLLESKSLTKVVTRDAAVSVEGVNHSACVLPTEFFYQSGDVSTNTCCLLILVNDGACAGHWSTGTVIEEGLEQGSQLPFIDRALSQNFAVVVLNTDNFTMPNTSRTKASDSPISIYINQVFQRLLHTSPAANICFVAHGRGALLVNKLSCMYPDQFTTRVTCVAFIDSPKSAYSSVLAKLNTCNWLTSDKPLGVLLNKATNTRCMEVSSGHTDTQWCPWSSFEDIFRYLQHTLYNATHTT